ncbi:uncharacterized protein RAG0_02603 [Rhynchosporium agropyri]|uniref:Uncharacterized protein n=1 Tax=Rhynchosporium agropyri TaxID=914238 RepID=A0A1E1K1T9_9HELO|nr:uncharacterized protein RAG0_02603 [Rhynchosporium agropyri]
MASDELHRKTVSAFLGLPSMDVIYDLSPQCSADPLHWELNSTQTSSLSANQNRRSSHLYRHISQPGLVATNSASSPASKDDSRREATTAPANGLFENFEPMMVFTKTGSP